MTQVISHYQIKFIAADGAIVSTMPSRNYVEAIALCENEAQWPAAAEIVELETVYRTAVRGIDYGRGSVANRFAGHTPKGAYQFR